MNYRRYALNYEQIGLSLIFRCCNSFAVTHIKMQSNDKKKTLEIKISMKYEEIW